MITDKFQEEVPKEDKHTHGSMSKTAKLRSKMGLSAGHLIADVSCIAAAHQQKTTSQEVNYQVLAKQLPDSCRTHNLET